MLFERVVHIARVVQPRSPFPLELGFVPRRFIEQEGGSNPVMTADARELGTLLTFKGKAAIEGKYAPDMLCRTRVRR